MQSNHVHVPSPSIYLSPTGATGKPCLLSAFDCTSGQCIFGSSTSCAIDDDCTNYASGIGSNAGACNVTLNLCVGDSSDGNTAGVCMVIN